MVEFGVPFQPPRQDLSNSANVTGHGTSYQLHANAYITTPVSLDLFTEAIRRVDDFFLTLVKLPAED